MQYTLLLYSYMVCFIPLVKANLKCILGFIHIHIALNFQQAHVFLIYENKKKITNLTNGYFILI